MTHQSIPPRLFKFTNKNGNLIEIREEGSEYLISFPKHKNEKIFATLSGYRYVSYNLDEIFIRDREGLLEEKFKLDKRVKLVKSNPKGTAFLLETENYRDLILITRKKKYRLNNKTENFGFLTDDYYYVERNSVISVIKVESVKPSFTYSSEFFYPLYEGYFVSKKEGQGIQLFQMIGSQIYEKGLLLRFNPNYKQEYELTPKWLKNFLYQIGIEFEESLSFEELLDLYYEWIKKLSVLEEEGIIEDDLQVNNFSFNERKVVCSFSYSDKQKGILEWRLSEGKIIGKPKIIEEEIVIKSLLLLSDDQLIINGFLEGKYLSETHYAFSSSDPLEVIKILRSKSDLPIKLIKESVEFL